MVDTETVSGYLDNAVVTGVAIFGVLALIGLAIPKVWLYLFTVCVSYVIADFMLNLIIVGGEGFAKIPIIGNEFQTKGHSFLAFFIAIIITTLLSSWMIDISNAYGESYFGWGYYVAIGSFIASLLVYFDLQVRFYDKDDSD